MSSIPGSDPDRPAAPKSVFSRRLALGAGAALGMGTALTGLARGDIASAQPGPARGSMVLANGGTSHHRIHVGADEGAVVRHAAEELASHLEQITGATFPIVVSPQPPTGPVIVIGRNNEVAGQLSIDPAALGEEGFALRTHGQTVLIAGGQPRGTLYGVYWVLDRLLGVRWWASDFAHIPDRPKLKINKADFTGDHVPRFRYRQIIDGEVLDASHQQRNLLTGRRGGMYQGLPTPAGLDTWSNYWPRDSYGATFHKMVPDQSLWYGGQLRCMEPRTRAMAAENIIATLRRQIANGNDASYGFEQQDADWSPPDPDSLAFAQQHGGALSAPVIDMVNDVQARVRKAVPEARLGTHAYWFSFPAPSGIRPAKGLVMTVAPIFANFANSLFTADNATEFGDHIVRWCELSTDVLLWDYLVNAINYLQPYPNWWAVGESIKTLAEHPTAQGYMGNAAWTSPGTPFADLRIWVISRLLWDATLDVDALIREFLDGYYGAAAGAVLAYMHLMHQALQDSDTRLSFMMTWGTPHLCFTTVRLADELLAQAEAAVANDDARRQHVQILRMGHDYLILVRRNVFTYAAAMEGRPWDPAVIDRLARFERALTASGLTEHKPNGMPASQLRELARIAVRQVDPADVASGLSATDWVDYQEPPFEYYLPVTSLVDDEGASNGSAVRMPGEGMAWGPRLRLDELPTDDTWQLYAVVRATTGQTPDVENVLAVGVSIPDRPQIKCLVTAAALADGEYRTIAIPGSREYDPTGKGISWIAPRGSTTTEAVFLDRIVAVRESRLTEIEFQEHTVQLYAPVCTVVSDASASNGAAVQMPGASAAWGPRLHLNLLPTTDSWRLYAVVRADISDDAPSSETVLAIGISIPGTPGARLNISAATLQDGQYHAIVVPGSYRCQESASAVAWVAARRSAHTATVHVDRFIAVRESPTATTYQEYAMELYAPAASVVTDPTASNKMAVEIPGSSRAWGPRLHLDQLPSDGAWKLTVWVRADTSAAPPDRAVLIAGVRLPDGQQVQATVTAAQLDGGRYVPVVIPGEYTRDASGVAQVFVAARSSQDVAAIYVDRIDADRT